MKERGDSRLLRRWFDGLPIRYVVFTIFTALVIATLTTLLNPVVEEENVRSLLTTLALAEASILAIVFSVTVVALQLVVTRYSARLTSLFVKEPLFRTTFTLFVGAIGFNLLVVYLLPAQNPRLTNALVGIAFALGVVSTISLYRFIQLMIQRSSPDELITVLIERELAPVEYLPYRSEEFHEIDVHPIRPLYRTITRALERGEYQTAEQGISGLRRVLIRSFEYIESEYSVEDGSQYATEISSEIFKTYFPDILEQAFTHEQYAMVSQAVADVEAIALDGLERDFTDVTEDAAEGLGDAFDAAPLTWEGNRVRNPVKESLLELTKSTATKADYTTFSSVSFHLEQQMAVLLRRRPDSNVTNRLVGNYYSREVVDIFEALLDRYASEVRNQDVNWISPTENGKWTLPDEAEPLRHFWQEYATLTRTVLQYRVSEGEYPFVEGSIYDGWKQFTENAAKSELDELATLCCISTIQLAYCVEKLEDGSVGLVVHNLGLLRRDYDPAIVDKAFGTLKEGKQPVGANISVRNVDPPSDDTNGGFFERFLRNKEEDSSFEKWLIDFEKEVFERTETLKQRD